jgi:bifunctional non-homologous end joining protein LigD
MRDGIPLDSRGRYGSCIRHGMPSQSRRRSERKPRASSRATPGKTNPDLSIDAYRRKRDFTKTEEPAPKSRRRSTKACTFVIQEHHATRLQWDFRLEADGVLKSWAVTKTPTLELRVRRLAVRTEDHPLDYATFSGTIPAGEYGAGRVMIWDRGTYENLMATKPEPMTLAESIAAGHVEVDLKGKKLRGKFTLVRMGGPSSKENWLLIKSRDQHAIPVPPATAPRGKYRTSGKQSPTTTAVTPNVLHATPPAKVSWTSEDKVLFPEADVTKGAVLRYYELIADKLLPHLRNRPITLERLPDGLRDGAPHFWQKDTPGHYPDWIPRVELPREDGKVVHYALCNDVATLLYMVNQAAVTLHPWFSRIDSLNRPDYVVFDLDRGPAPFADVVKIAKQLHRQLEKLMVSSYLKTSGKTGLHVMVPWEQPGDFPAAREWATSVANEVAGQLRDMATTERSKTKRGNRVYVDVMQNDRGKHAVPPYVVRATPLATVSTPLQWDELTPALDPRKFDLLTAAKRFAKQKKDPMLPLVR